MGGEDVFGDRFSSCNGIFCIFSILFKKKEVMGSQKLIETHCTRASHLSCAIQKNDASHMICLNT